MKRATIQNAVLLSLLFPGVGHMLCLGQAVKGSLFLALAVYCGYSILSDGGALFVVVYILWVAFITSDAFGLARYRARGGSIGRWDCAVETRAEKR